MADSFTHVLVRCTVADGARLTEAAARWCAQAPVPLALQRAAWQRESGTAYVYGRLAARAQADAAALQALRETWVAACPDSTGVQVDGLDLVFDAPGHSSGAAPRFHYVVEMDPEAGWRDELERWYDTEHMPGLAAVPGCIHARRLLNAGHGPLSLACYDLVTQETLGSPPWLAVRATDWSSRVRPHFTNTRRTMMEVLA